MSEQQPTTSVTAGEVSEAKAFTKLDTVRALVRPTGALVGIVVIAATPIVGAIVHGLTWKEAITIEVTFFGPLVGFFYQLRNSQSNGGAS
jgi:hypothetical protein